MARPMPMRTASATARARASAPPMRAADGAADPVAPDAAGASVGPYVQPAPVVGALEQARHGHDERQRPLPARRALGRARAIVEATGRPSTVSGSAARTCPRSASTARRPSRPAACRGSSGRRGPPSTGAARRRGSREPSVTWAGPSRIRSSEPTVPTLMRVPRGSVGDGAAMPQFVPRPGRLLGAGQRRADHQHVRAGGDRLGQLAAAAHAAVGDDRHVAAGLGEVRVARRRDVADGGHLRHADAEHLARRARGARADADEDRRGALVHQREGGLGVGRVADRDRDGHVARELGERQRVVARSRGGAPTRPGTGRGTGRRRARRRTGRTGGRPPGVAATAACEPAAWISSSRRATRSSRIGCRVGLGEERLDLVVGRGRDPLEDLVRVVVAGLDALEVEDREAAEPRERAGEPGVDDGVHRRRQDRDRQRRCRRTSGRGRRRPARSCRCRAPARRPRSRRSGGSCRPSSGRRAAGRRVDGSDRGGRFGSRRSLPSWPPHGGLLWCRESTSAQLRLPDARSRRGRRRASVRTSRRAPGRTGRRGCARSRSDSRARRPVVGLIERRPSGVVVLVGQASARRPRARRTAKTAELTMASTTARGTG